MLLAVSTGSCTSWPSVGQEIKLESSSEETDFSFGEENKISCACWVPAGRYPTHRLSVHVHVHVHVHVPCNTPGPQPVMTDVDRWLRR